MKNFCPDPDIIHFYVPHIVCGGSVLVFVLLCISLYPFLFCNHPGEEASWLLCFNWASSRENLSSGFLSKRLSNLSPQLQRLARKLKFQLQQG